MNLSRGEEVQGEVNNRRVERRCGVPVVGKRNRPALHNEYNVHKRMKACGHALCSTDDHETIHLLEAVISQGKIKALESKS